MIYGQLETCNFTDPRNYFNFFYIFPQSLILIFLQKHKTKTVHM